LNYCEVIIVLYDLSKDILFANFVKFLVNVLISLLLLIIVCNGCY